MQLTFLGTGTSHGIPVIGCACPICRSRDKRDRRNRASVFAETNGRNILIDASPEFRLQALAAGIQQVDAMLLTHAHADHIGGLDDLRIFSERSGRPFPIYGPAWVLDELKERFGYIFRRTQKGGGKPRLKLHAISAPFRIGETEVIPLPVRHGRLPIFGYRLGGFAYLTDVSDIPVRTYRLLGSLDVLVLDALRPLPHATHFHLNRAVAEAVKIGARRTFFTHMCHLLGHRETQQRLPSGLRLAYDGLRLKLRD